MNYIGSKYSLIDFLKETIIQTVIGDGFNKDSKDVVFADIFAGTGVVGGSFKSLGYKIIANDIQYYSYILNKHMIENNGNLVQDRIDKLIYELNNQELIEGFIYNNYAPSGNDNIEYKRMYFTDYNAKKCDTIRTKIEEWYNIKYINESEYYFLLASLIESIDKHANTTSVYGAYLKSFKNSALKKFILLPAPIMHGKVECKVYNEDVNVLINEISGDILYLDPPYNTRQYASNYHILETIAKNDNPKIFGKTGMRDYKSQKSEFSSKVSAYNALDSLISNAKFKYIFLSYNNEGILSLEQVKEIMAKYGDYSLKTIKYRRYKADNSRNNKTDHTYEYLHCLIKRKFN